MKKEMLINANQAEECRIAIVEDGILEELYVERSSQESYVGNIYKGKIVNIEPNIQAAFVDFGIGRNGFLHVSDVDPVYYKHLLPKDVLARIEAEDNEAYGVDRSPIRQNSGGRENKPGRDREPDRVTSPPARIEPRPMPVAVSFDAPPPLPVVAYAKPEEPEAWNDDDGFGVGLIDEDVTKIIPAAAARTPIALPPVEAPRPVAIVHEVALIPTPKEEYFDDGFGAGLLDDDDAIEVIDLQVASPPEVAAVVPAEEIPEIEAAPVKPRSRSRAKPKAEEPAAEADEAVAKTKAKPRRTTKKKAEGDEPADDKTQFMSGAERRTSPEDQDEPEINSFFGGGIDFDPDAPNDRFAGQSEENDNEGDGFEVVDETPDGAAFSEETTPELDLPESVIGRGFNDDADGEYRGSDDRKNDRRGGSGGGGGRGGDRDRGRGGRGDRERPRTDRSGERNDRSGDRNADRGVDRNNDRGGDRNADRSRRPASAPAASSSSGGGGRPARDRGLPRLPIEKVFKRGQEVIVQVIKEAIGTKAPNLSTYVSIAGRYLVLMPSLTRFGVSRKIEDPEARRRLRDIMTDLDPPKGVGFIVRTAAVDRDANELQSDLAYLLRLWQVVVRRIKRVAAPVEIYRESDMITRTIRDVFTKDIDAIWVDDATAFQHASEFLQIVMPRFADRIKLHEQAEPLFHRHRIEEEIAQLNHKKIDMPRGGSIIIEQTEALVAIDVNSGNFRADNNAEETAYQMNMIAAKEIARQLRLRDLGGVIVNDFIDMRDEKHRRNVENTLRDALERDKARTKILRISQFGIIEMTRQRIQTSLKRRIYNECTHCKATGYIRTNETTGIEVMRLLQLATHRAMVGTPAVSSVHVTVHTDASYYILNSKRKEIAALEDRAKIEIVVQGILGVSPDYLELKCHDANGNEVRLLNPGPPPKLGNTRPNRPLPERRFPAQID